MATSNDSKRIPVHVEISGQTPAGPVAPSVTSGAEGVMLKALPTNSAPVPFGVAAGKHDQLDPGERLFIRISNPSLIYHDLSELADTDKLVVTVIA